MAKSMRNNMLADRVSDVGLARYAIEFYCAAVVVSEALGQDHYCGSQPAYSLLGRSIELALKSLLRRDGWEPSELRRLGHDLVRCLSEVEEAKSNRADPAIGLTLRDRQLLELFSEAYAGKDFEYFGSGRSSVPRFYEISRIAKVICGFAVNSIEPGLLRGKVADVFRSDIPQPPPSLTRSELAQLFAAELRAERAASEP